MYLPYFNSSENLHVKSCLGSERVTAHYIEQAKQQTVNCSSWSPSQSCGLRSASKQVTMRMCDLQASTRFRRICVSRSSASRKLGFLQSMLASTWTATVPTTVSLSKRAKMRMFCFMLSREIVALWKHGTVPNNQNTWLLSYGLSAGNSVSVADCLCLLNRQLWYKQNDNE